MTDSSTRPFRLAVCQCAPRPGDLTGNADHVTRLATQVDANLLLFPELMLTGYDVRERVHELSLEAASLPARIKLARESAAAIGFIERTSHAVPYNAAALLDHDATVVLHRKLYLPTYGMFDEGRYFGRGRQVATCRRSGWTIGILVCEDFWHPALCYLLACQQVDLLLVLAAAPGREVATTSGQTTFRSTAVWERIARTSAQLYGIYVALCNRVGVEGGVTFAGGSLVVGPQGDVLAAAPGCQEEILEVSLDRAELERARRPYAHLRDEEPRIVVEELQRILAAADAGR